MKRNALLTLAVTALALGLTSSANAEDIAGTFKMKGKTNGKATSSFLTVKKLRTRYYEITRKVTVAGKTEIWSGKGWYNSSRVTIEFKGLESEGIIGALDLAGTSRKLDVRGVFKFSGNDNVSVDYYKVKRRRRTAIGTASGVRSVAGEGTDGDTSTGEGGDTSTGDGSDSGTEDGSGSDGDSDGDSDTETGLSILFPPADKVFLVGQVLEVKTRPETAKITVEGSAKVIDGKSVQFTGVGEATITATSDGESPKVIKAKIISAEVVEVSVQGGISIIDARAPHYQRAFQKEEVSQLEPAAILKQNALVLSVKLQGSEDLGEAASVTLIGRANGVSVRGKGQVSSLKSGSAITVTSETPINDKVAINSLDFQWSIAGSQATAEDSGLALEGPKTSLRIYTSFKTPLENVRGASKVATKWHFEKACEWADGASENVGSGAKSIAWNIDNKMRHYVHPRDYGSYKPVVFFYEMGSTPPTNYDDLPSKWSVRNGRRGISSLYYPPLEPEEEYEKYYNYKNNFGWNLLDNKTHTGGRCNQQASLVCDIVGTLGIKASVHYLQRTGYGKESGRPVRQYFYAAGGSGPWNFHGIVRATMGDGSEWLYDGSFSSPPRRLNGSREWAEKPGGPFIQKWGPWYYQDSRYSEKVPESDQPKRWSGIQ